MKTKKRIPIVIPKPNTGTGKTFTSIVAIGKKGRGRTYHISKQTPFLSIDKEVILVGDLILLEANAHEVGTPEKPMKVCFGQYKAGSDDFGIDYIVYGFYIEFHDGGTYSLTQEGKGYSIAAMNCKIVKKK